MNLIIPDAGCVEHLVSIDDTARGEVTGVYRTACGVRIGHGPYAAAYLQDCLTCYAIECGGARPRRNSPTQGVTFFPGDNTAEETR